MSIDWMHLKKRLERLPPHRHRALMEDAWVQFRGRGDVGEGSPQELAEYLGVSAELVEIALASDRDRVNER